MPLLVSRRRYCSAVMGDMPMARARTSSRRRAGQVRALGRQHRHVVVGALERALLGEHAHLEPARVVLDGIESHGARQGGQHQQPVDCADGALHGGDYSDSSRAKARDAEVACVRLPRRGIGADGPPELGRARPRIGGDLLVRWA